MVVQLKQGCCCSLKAATVTIGVLGIVGGLCMMLSPVIDYSQSHAVPTPKMHDPNDARVVVYEHVEAFMRIFNVVLGLIAVTISTVLVVGAVKGRPKLVYPWIVLHVVDTVLGSIVLVVLALYLAITVNLLAGVLLIIGAAINALIQSYMILVVNSYHTTILSPPTYDYSMNKEPIMYA